MYLRLWFRTIDNKLSLYVRVSLVSFQYPLHASPKGKISEYIRNTASICTKESDQCIKMIKDPFLRIMLSITFCFGRGCLWKTTTYSLQVGKKPSDFVFVINCFYDLVQLIQSGHCYHDYFCMLNLYTILMNKELKVIMEFNSNTNTVNAALISYASYLIIIITITMIVINSKIIKNVIR